MSNVSVHDSDLAKIEDALHNAVAHHRARDESNAVLHLAREVRWSPLTSDLMAALQRVRQLRALPDGAQPQPPQEEA